MKSAKKTIVALGLWMLSGSSLAYSQNVASVMVGGTAMYANKNIVENAMKSKEHTTLMSTLKSTGLEQTLQSAGPYTLLAPTNEAFNKLPKGTVGILLKPENKDKLTTILNYHLLPGKISSSDLMNMIQKGGGTYTVKTVQGGMLAFFMKGKDIMVKDEKGGLSRITIKDVNQSNGVIHVINTLLLPNG